MNYLYSMTAIFFLFFVYSIPRTNLYTFFCFYMAFCKKIRSVSNEKYIVTIYAH